MPLLMFSLMILTHLITWKCPHKMFTKKIMETHFRHKIRIRSDLFFFQWHLVARFQIMNLKLIAYWYATLLIIYSAANFMKKSFFVTFTSKIHDDLDIILWPLKNIRIQSLIRWKRIFQFSILERQSCC